MQIHRITLSAQNGHLQMFEVVISLSSISLREASALKASFSSSSLLLSSLGLSDTKAYGTYIRARLGTAAYLCEVVVLTLRTEGFQLNPKPVTQNTKPQTPNSKPLAEGLRSGARDTHRHTCGPISPYSGRDCVKSLRSSYTGLYGRGTARAEDAQGTPTQSHISPSILVYVDIIKPCL